MIRNLLWSLFYNQGDGLPPLELQSKELLVSGIIAVVILLLYVWPVRFHRLFFRMSWNARKARSSALRFLIISALTWVILSLDLAGVYIPKFTIANIVSIFVLVIWLGFSVFTLVDLVNEGNR